MICLIFLFWRKCENTEISFFNRLSQNSLGLTFHNQLSRCLNLSNVVCNATCKHSWILLISVCNYQTHTAALSQKLWNKKMNLINWFNIVYLALKLTWKSGDSGISKPLTEKKIFIFKFHHIKISQSKFHTFTEPLNCDFCLACVSRLEFGGLTFGHHNILDRCQLG